MSSGSSSKTRGEKRVAADSAEPKRSAKKPRVSAIPVSASASHSGLLSLTTTVLDDILDNVLLDTRFITRGIVLSNQTHLGEEFRARADVLRPIMHTCRGMRAVCLPRFYEHTEMAVVWGKKVWYKQLSERMEKMSKTLVKMAGPASHIRVVTVSLTRCSTDTVLPAFATCLKALPNLHTLQVIHAHSQMTTPLKKAFEKVSLPQIKTLILPSCAHNILRSCPNVTDLTCNAEDGKKLVTALTQASIRNVEVIQGIFTGAYGIELKKLAKAAPKLRKLTVRAFEELEGIVAIKLLDTLHVRVRVYATWGWTPERLDEAVQEEIKTLEAQIPEMKKMLKASQATTERLLEITVTAIPHVRPEIRDSVDYYEHAIGTLALRQVFKV